MSLRLDGMASPRHFARVRRRSLSFLSLLLLTLLAFLPNRQQPTPPGAWCFAGVGAAWEEETGGRIDDVSSFPPPPLTQDGDSFSSPLLPSHSTSAQHPEVQQREQQENQWSPLSMSTYAAADEWLSPSTSISSSFQFDLMSVLGATGISLLPAPKVIAAVVVQELTAVQIVFDGPTNQPGASGNCGEIFTLSSLAALFSSTTPPLGYEGTPCPLRWDTQCKWTTPMTLKVTWSGQEKQESQECYVPLRMTPHPLPSLTLRENTLRDAFAAAAYITGTAAVISIQLIPAVNFLLNLPVPELVAPDVIGSCDALVLSLTDGVLGNAGKPFEEIEWNLISPEMTPANGFTTEATAALQSALLSASNPSLNTFDFPSTLTIASAALPGGADYEFGIRVRNWLALQGETSVIVTKSSLALPTVQFKAGALIKTSRYSALKIDAAYAASACAGGVAGKPLKFVWKVRSQDVNATRLFLSSQPPPLFLPSGSLLPNTTYRFKLYVVDENGATPVNNSAKVKVEVEAVYPPVLMSSQFSDAITSLTLLFSSDSNQAGMLSSSRCDAILAPDMLSTVGEGPKCTWASPKSLIVVLGSAATIDTSTSVSLYWSRLTSADGFSLPASPPNATVYTQAPMTVLMPIPRLRGSLSIGLGDDILLSGATSTGHGGREFRSWNWTIKEDQVGAGNPITMQGYADVREYLAMQTGSDIDIPSALLVPGGLYRVALSLTNFLGVTAKTCKNVTVSREAIPRVSVLEDPPEEPLPSVTVSARVGLSLPPSWPISLPARIECGWHVKAPHDDSIIPEALRKFSYVYQPEATQTTTGRIARTGGRRKLHASPEDETETTPQNMFIWTHQPHALSAGFSSKFGHISTYSSRHSSSSHSSSRRLLASLSTSVLSTSTYFSLPPYLLDPGQTYEFVLSVTLTGLNSSESSSSASSLSFNSASLTVSVGHSPLVAAITGGDRLVSLKQGVDVSIASTHSYDPDAVSKYGSLFVPGTGLNYTWSCEKVVSGAPCFPAAHIQMHFLPIPTIYLPPKLFTDALSLDAFGTAEGFRFILVVTVLDGTQREGRAESVITVTTQQVPEVTLLKLYTLPKPNSAETIKFHAVVLPADDTYVLKWRIINPPLTLSQSDSSTGLNSFDLSLLPGTLSPGVSYTLQLLASSSSSLDNVGKGQITFTTNTPPSGGKCKATPEEGRSVDNSYAFVCKNWNTELTNQPLSYAFILQKQDASGKDASVFLSSYSSNPSINLDVMPAGDPSLNYTQTVRIIISDKFGCTSSQDVSVIVRPSEALGNGTDGAKELLNSLATRILAPAVSSGNIQSFAPAFLTAASLLPPTTYTAGLTLVDFYKGIGSNRSASTEAVEQRTALLAQVTQLPNTVNTLTTISQRLQLSHLVCNDPLAMDSEARKMCTEYVEEQVALTRATQFFAPGRSLSTLGEQTPAINTAPINAIPFTPQLTSSIFDTLDAVMFSVNVHLADLAASNLASSSSSPLYLNGSLVPSVVEGVLSPSGNLSSYAEGHAHAEEVARGFVRIVNEVSQGSVIDLLTTEGPNVIKTKNLYLSSQVHSAALIGGVTLRVNEGMTELMTGESPRSSVGTVTFPYSLSSQIPGLSSSELIATTFFTYSQNIYSFLDLDPRLERGSKSTSGIVSVSFFLPSTASNDSLPIIFSFDPDTNLTSSTPVLGETKHVKVEGLKAPVRIEISHEVLDSRVYMSELNSSSSHNSSSSLNSSLISTEFEYQSRCRFFDPLKNDWSSEGCTVDVAHSTPVSTVCLCTHLTDFNLHSLLVEKSDFTPRLLIADEEDVREINWRNLTAHPIPLLCVLLVLSSYLFLLPLIHTADLKQMVLWLEGKEVWRKHEEINYLHICERWMILMKGTFVYRHMWFGILFRRPGEVFTSAQKFTCCISILLGAMAVSAFFRAEGTVGDVSSKTAAQLFLSDILIGLYSSFLLLPVKLLFIECFRRSGKSWKQFKEEYGAVKLQLVEEKKRKHMEEVRALEDDAPIPLAIGKKKKEQIVNRLGMDQSPQSIGRALAKSPKVKAKKELSSSSRSKSLSSKSSLSSHSRSSLAPPSSWVGAIPDAPAAGKTSSKVAPVEDIAILVAPSPALTKQRLKSEGVAGAPDFLDADQAVLLGIEGSPEDKARRLERGYEGGESASSTMASRARRFPMMPIGSPQSQGLRRRVGGAAGAGGEKECKEQEEEEAEEETSEIPETVAPGTVDPSPSFSSSPILPSAPLPLSSASDVKWSLEMVRDLEAEEEQAVVDPLGASESESEDAAAAASDLPLSSLGPRELSCSHDEKGEWKKRMIWNPSAQEGEEKEEDGGLEKYGEEGTTKEDGWTTVTSTKQKRSKQKQKRVLWNPVAIDDDDEPAPAIRVELPPAPPAVTEPSPKLKRRQLWSPDWKDPSEVEAEDEEVKPDLPAQSELPPIRKKRILFNPVWTDPNALIVGAAELESSDHSQVGGGASTTASSTSSLHQQGKRRTLWAGKEEHEEVQEVKQMHEEVLDTTKHTLPTHKPARSSKTKKGVSEVMQDKDAMILTAAVDLTKLADVSQTQRSVDSTPRQVARPLPKPDGAKRQRSLLKAVNLAAVADASVIDVPPSPAVPGGQLVSTTKAPSTLGAEILSVQPSAPTTPAVPADGAEVTTQKPDDIDLIDERETRLPHACLYVTYFLCFLWCAASSFVIVLYGLKFDLLDFESRSNSGWSTSSKWLANVLQAVAQDLLIIDPILIAVTTFGQLWLGAGVMRWCLCCKATGDVGHD
jgi:hypothetical protein